MAIDFNGININKAKQQAEQPERPDREPAREARAEVNVDRVEISQQAKSIERLEEHIHNAEDFDQARVRDITRAIAEGRYPVDSERIAMKFLELEHQLYS